MAEKWLPKVFWGQRWEPEGSQGQGVEPPLLRL